MSGDLRVVRRALKFAADLHGPCRELALPALDVLERVEAAAGCAEYALMTGAEDSRREALALLRTVLPTEEK